MEYVSVIFCRRCGSRYVEVPEWSEGGAKKAVIRCRSCGTQEEISNFTLGRCGVTRPELQKAHDTRALKDRYEK